MIYKILVIAALLPSLFLPARAEEKERDVEPTGDNDESGINAESEPTSEGSIAELSGSLKAAFSESPEEGLPSVADDGSNESTIDLAAADEFFAQFSESNAELFDVSPEDFNTLIDRLFSSNPAGAGKKWISDELRIVGAVRALLEHGERQAKKRRAEVSEDEWIELVRTGMIQTHLDTDMGRSIGNAKLTFHRLNVPCLMNKASLF